MNHTWTTIPEESFVPVRNSGCTRELARSQWPPWARGAHQVQRIFAYGIAPSTSAPSNTTTSELVGRLVSERYDKKDSDPYNYDWYAVVQVKNGALLQSGPHKDVDFGHHLAQPVSAGSLGL
jgi:hypothetical protein